MNRSINKSTLQYLGPDFQYKLAKCFIEEPGYFTSIYSVVEQNAFTEPLLKQFVGTLKDYYSTNGNEWTQIGGSYKMIFDYRRFFMGTKFAIFNYATKKLGGHVDIDAFEVN